MLCVCLCFLMDMTVSQLSVMQDCLSHAIRLRRLSLRGMGAVWEA